MVIMASAVQVIVQCPYAYIALSSPYNASLGLLKLRLGGLGIYSYHEQLFHPWFPRS